MVDIGVVHKSLVVGKNSRGRDLGDFPFPSRRIPGGVQELNNFLRYLKIGVFGILLGVDQKLPGRRNGSDNVHVAARSEAFGVPCQAARKPDGVGSADGSGKFSFHLRFAPSGVAGRIQLNCLGDQHSALSVDLDSAAFVDQA
jgi:hypothetical protein